MTENHTPFKKPEQTEKHFSVCFVFKNQEVKITLDFKFTGSNPFHHFRVPMWKTMTKRLMLESPANDGVLFLEEKDHFI